MYEIKIYTEDFPNISEIVSHQFKNFTLTYGQGHWEGAKENSVIVILITSALAHAKVVAEEIKITNNQDAVLVTWHEVEQELI